MVRFLRWVRRHVGLVLELLGYAFWLMIDVVAASSIDDGGLSLVASVVVPVLVLCRRRPGARLTRVAMAALGTSLTISVGSAVRHALTAPLPYGVDLSFTENLALALLVIEILRRLRLRPALVLTGAAAVAIVATAAARITPDPLTSSIAVVCALGWGGSVLIGLTLREVDSRRRVALDDARATERMAMARELHDVVAHQVTGIVVAAQAAAVVARTAPHEVDRALAAIEAEGTEALTAMRRMVGVLRGEATGNGTRTPGVTLADLPALVARFDPDEQLVRLAIDVDLSRIVLPAGVAATGYRIVQEALTNVRRHAPDATAVEIDVQLRDSALLVSVRNDGSRPAHRGDSGGFGLAGMAERADALDGDLTAGPAADGVWLVSARLPLTGATT